MEVKYLAKHTQAIETGHANMYQPTPDINDLILHYIQSPHDPLLQEQIAVLKAAGLEQASYVESRLEAWLKEGAVPPKATPAQVKVVAAASPHSFKWLWMAAVATVVLLIGGFTWYQWQRPGKMTLHANHTDHIDSLLLTKGSSVVLNKESVISYADKFDITPAIKVLAGDAYFNIKEPANILVQLDEHNTLRVSQAAFNIHKTKTSVAIFVVSGKATIVPNKGKAVLLTANMSGNLDHHHPLQKKMLKSQAALAWKTGRLQFKNIPLEEVLTAINSYYGLEITVPPSAKSLYKQKLTANFEKKSDKEIIEMLRKMLAVHIVKDSANAYYITMK
ncbi:FecR family protein [Chitinophaga niastensis]|uniref:FecR family protein n=1 Tax=Chitinophaga niastensis TaxID=536980 RepID=A0A2P8HM12_CHINA|nr:FecR domain-containing protein [Chitinophaga niastensis]PSL47254.1 FecR family protein [Chitinophaga niastensis]